MASDGQMAELMRALLDPRVAWSTARRGDPRLHWWRSFTLGLLVAMFACAGAFVGTTRLLSRVMETQSSGLVPLLLVVLAFVVLAAAAAYFVLIMVGAASRLMDP